MRPYLPPGPHVPHEARSVFEGRQLNARPTLRLDHTRPREAEIMLLGLRHATILRVRGTIRRSPIAEHEAELERRREELKLEINRQIGRIRMVRPKSK
jgi:hypothetical protein